MSDVQLVGASVHGPGGRPGLRFVLAAVAAVDLVTLGWWLTANGVNDRSHPLAPAFLLELGSLPWLVYGLLAVGLFACWRFARGTSAGLFGALIVVLSALFVEAQAAVVGGPMRNFFYAGGLLVGWLAGLAIARQLRVTGPQREQLAEAGACGVLAASYVSASLHKLGQLGLGFADNSTLRAIVASHHTVDDTSVLGIYAHTVIEQPEFGQTLATLTLVIQLGAVCYLLGPRLRMLWGTLLLAFHFNVLLLTGIPYVEPMVFLVAFSYPWRRWLAKAGDTPRSVEPVPRPSVRSIGIGVLLVAGGVALARGSQINEYTSMHHHARDEAGSPVADRAQVGEGPTVASHPSAPAVQRFGPLEVGQPLAGEWTIASMHRHTHETRIAIERSGEAGVVLTVRAQPEQGRRGAFTVGGLDIGYRTTDVPFSEFSPAGADVASLLEATGLTYAELVDE